MYQVDGWIPYKSCVIINISYFYYIFIKMMITKLLLFYL